MEKRTVNIVTHLYPPSVGGVERHSYNMAKQLVKSGYRVNVITTNSHLSSGLHTEEGINIYVLKSFTLVEGRFPIPYNPIDLIKVFRRFFSKNSFAIIQTRLFLTSFWGILFARLSRGKALVIEHGSGHLEYRNGIINFIFELYEHFFTFILRVFKPDFYAVSKSGSDWLMHFNIKSKGEIYNGIDPSSFENVKIPEKIEKFSRLKVVTYLGRLIQEKGVLELVKAFKSINKDDLRLVIAGNGVLEQEIADIAMQDNRILFLGKLSHDNALGLLSKTDIFVNPSNYPEGLPTIVLEAGFLALPIISTPNGGAKEVIRHLETGYLINKGKEAEIADALNYMVANHEDAKEVGKNLKALIEETYTWEKITAKLIKLIETN